jgi:hypothetical protein
MGRLLTTSYAPALRRQPLAPLAAATLAGLLVAAPVPAQNDVSSTAAQMEAARQRRELSRQQQELGEAQRQITGAQIAADQAELRRQSSGALDAAGAGVVTSPGPAPLPSPLLAAPRETGPASVLQQWRRAAAPRRERYPDFDAVALAPDVPVSLDMVRLMAYSPYAADIAYYLGKHRDEAERIAAMGFLDAAAAIQRIERKVAAPEPSRQPRNSLLL